jgi:hypothetical protein
MDVVGILAQVGRLAGMYGVGIINALTSLVLALTVFYIVVDGQMPRGRRPPPGGDSSDSDDDDDDDDDSGDDPDGQVILPICNHPAVPSAYWHVCIALVAVIDSWLLIFSRCSSLPVYHSVLCNRTARLRLAAPTGFGAA